MELTGQQIALGALGIFATVGAGVGIYKYATAEPKCSAVVSKWSECGSDGRKTRTPIDQDIYDAQTDEWRTKCPLLDTKTCVVNCILSEWVDGACSKTCGGGTLTSTRSVLTPAKNGGSVCDTSNMSTTKECNIQACPIHCKWNSSICNPTGNMTETYILSNSTSDPTCDSSIVRNSTRTTSCAFNCTGNWGPWDKTDCNASDIQTRTFIIKNATNGGAACNWATTETRACLFNCSGDWEWGSCIDGTQDGIYRIYKEKVGLGMECEAINGTTTKRNCSPCTGTYSAWSTHSTVTPYGNTTRLLTITQPPVNISNPLCTFKDSLNATENILYNSLSVGNYSYLSGYKYKESRNYTDCIGSWGGWGTCNNGNTTGFYTITQQATPYGECKDGNRVLVDNSTKSSTCAFKLSFTAPSSNTTQEQRLRMTLSQPYIIVSGDKLECDVYITKPIDKFNIILKKVILLDNNIPPDNSIIIEDIKRSNNWNNISYDIGTNNNNISINKCAFSCIFNPNTNTNTNSDTIDIYIDNLRITNNGVNKVFLFNSLSSNTIFEETVPLNSLRLLTYPFIGNAHQLL
jgi:hypothetical protein